MFASSDRILSRPRRAHKRSPTASPALGIACLVKNGQHDDPRGFDDEEDRKRKHAWSGSVWFPCERLDSRVAILRCARMRPQLALRTRALARSFALRTRNRIR